MSILSLLIVVPLLFAIISLFAKQNMVRGISLIGNCIQLLLVCYIGYEFLQVRDLNPGEMTFTARHIWYESFGIEYYIGLDGISMVMIALTAIVGLTGTLISWKIEKNPREFFFLLSMMSIGAYGFFISLDLFTLFFFLELAVIPKFLLIAKWGSGKKEYSAMKLALMLMGGSALILTGILALKYHTSGIFGPGSFSMMQIAQQGVSHDVQLYIFPLLFAGFGIFTALFPFHTWVPDGHSSAPTAASMFLAGISMKLGGYGCLRVAVYLLPEAAQDYSGIIVALSTIAIIYGAFATLRQTDLKYINAYSSVSHCGFVLFGIGMLTKTAVMGAVMQMVSHGLMTALFFGVIGMIYERTHTRNLADLGGLLKVMPFIGAVYVIAGLCSLGLPGFSGFVSEMTIFTGSWEVNKIGYRIATLLACASIVVTAVYILRATGKAVMGPITNPEFLHLKDAAWYEKSAGIILILVILLIGVLPFLFTGMISSETDILFQQFSSCSMP